MESALLQIFSLLYSSLLYYTMINHRPKRHDFSLHQIWILCIKLWPSDLTLLHRTWWSLVLVMACRLFDVKPLPEPTLIYCRVLDIHHKKVLIKIQWLEIKKIQWRIPLPKWRSFCSGLDVFIGTQRPRARQLCCGFMDPVHGGQFLSKRGYHKAALYIAVTTTSTTCWSKQVG